MKTERNKRKLDNLLVLLLFGMFAICILSVLLTGADVYQRLSVRDRDSYDQRTAAQYLTTRIRQADQMDSVSVRDFKGQDALVFTEIIEGSTYETLVYCYNGYLRELFVVADGDFLPEDGEKVLEAQGLAVSLDGRIVHVEVTGAAGEEQMLTIYLRSGRGQRHEK